jgi:hypothetical protein
MGIERIWWRFGHILEACCIADVEGWVFDIRPASGRARDRVFLGAILQRSKPRSRFVKWSGLRSSGGGRPGLFGFEGTYDVAEAPDHEDDKQRVPKVLKHYSPP